MADHRVLVLAVSIPFLVLASIFVGLYFISSIFVVKRLELNDYLMLLAWIIDVGYMASLFVATGKGLGVHEQDIKPTNYYGLDRADYVFTVLYGPASMAAKSSVLTFYLTLTQGTKVFHRANYITLFLVNAGGLALTLVDVFACPPLGTEEHCTEPFMVALASAPLNIVTDVIILFLPIPLLTRMSLPWKQKVILVITFSAGFGVIVVDVIRIAFLQGAVRSGSPTTSNLEVGHDSPWLASLSFMWAGVEVNMTIICACVPSLKPLADRFGSRMIRDTDEGAPAAASQDGTRPTPAGDMMAVLTTPSGQPTETEPYITVFGISNFKPASLPRLNNKKAFRPLAFIFVIFGLAGVSYGILDTLSSKFIIVAGLSALHDSGLRATYWSGYLLGSLLVGRHTLKISGYRNTFIVGLCTYGCGTLIFWPSGASASFVAFIISNLIIGSGLGVLNSAGSFATLCGPLENSEMRLNLVQAGWAFGSALSYLLAQKAILKSVRDVVGLASVQWVFLGTAFFNVLLAVSFWYLRLPEAPDEDLEELANRRHDNFAKVAGVPVTWWTLGLGIWSLFFVNAGLEITRTGIQSFVKATGGRLRLEPFEYVFLSRLLYGTCRVLIALSLWYFKPFKPRWLLLAVNIGVIVLSILCTKTSGMAAIIVCLLAEFFQGGGLPLTFAIALRGQGPHTKTAGSLLAATISAPTFSTFTRQAAAVAHGDRYVYNLMVAFWSASIIFPLYLNLVPAARKHVDPVLDEYLHE